MATRACSRVNSYYFPFSPLQPLMILDHQAPLLSSSPDQRRHLPMMNLFLLRGSEHGGATGPTLLGLKGDTCPWWTCSCSEDLSTAGLRVQFQTTWTEKKHSFYNYGRRARFLYIDSKEINLVVKWPSYTWFTGVRFTYFLLVSKSGLSTSFLTKKLK